MSCPATKTRPGTDTDGNPLATLHRSEKPEHILFHAALEIFAMRGGYLARLTDTERWEFVYAFLEVIASRHLKLSHQNPLCAECGEAAEEWAVQWRGYLEAEDGEVQGRLRASIEACREEQRRLLESAEGVK